ncbi:KR domain-containing protein [Lentzea atacamensis]|uniref:KR domain-containing protein n=1 Tax=Lentzea atacamensis TaxID=531938 RepID=A0A316HEG0_9PSEU|nr:SDR family NAD(P)-dependent oxidoreductase [Lentzea atacamensis]PWK78553.1 KR domain-containing protein [Lentzea atacamensis]
MTVQTLLPGSTPDTPAVRRHQVAWQPEGFTRPLDRLVYSPHPVSLPADADATWLVGRAVCLLGADTALVDQVGGELTKAGVVVRRPETDGSAPDGVDGIIDLNVLGSGYALTEQSWQEPMRQSARALHSVYDRWVGEARFGHHFYVTVTHLGGRMGYGGTRIPQPLSGAWAGLCKGLQYELPATAQKVVDVDDITPDRIARVLLLECGRWDLSEIGHLAGERTTLMSAKIPNPEPTLDLGPSDTVVITGGGRGIGFVAAEGLAAATGCRVVVTGREQPPAGHVWLDHDDEEFAAWRWRELQATEPGQLRETRLRIERTINARTIHQNLKSGRAKGLRIDYVPCDCTDPAQVRELFDRVGGPTVLMHNAGIDNAVRFNQQSPDTVVRIVSVKIDGLATMLAEIRRRPDLAAKLKLVSGVGSLSGRLGGMIGQVSYAAANDGLTRLNCWVRDELGIPAQTVLWHTWEGVGSIVRPHSAVRYTSTIEPSDGMAHWVREVLSGTQTEVLFMGRFGSAIVPHQVRNRLLLMYGNADYTRWTSADFHLGELTRYQLHREIECVNVLRRADHPCFADVTVGGRPAVPASVVLEHAISVGDWVGPYPWPRQHLQEITDIDIRIDALVFTEDELHLVKRGHGTPLPDGRWQVTVEVDRRDGTRVASVNLVYGESPAVVPAVDAADVTGEDQPLSAGQRYRSNGLVFRVPRWRKTTGGQEIALPAVTPTDLWMLPFEPEITLPSGVVEALLAVASANNDDMRVTISRIVVAPGSTKAVRLLSTQDGGAWTGVTESGMSVVRIEHCGFGGLRRTPDLN